MGSCMTHRVLPCPGVKVTLTNPATGLRRELMTDENGAYDFEAVVPSEYTITFESESSILIRSNRLWWPSVRRSLWTPT